FYFWRKANECKRKQRIYLCEL
ncbi:hypothetical protein A5844_000782, partial [Enterococcus sp. 10A9_DIV0425]